jgi:diguanylate cyclase (GGDEF)-like protein/putative nucleotidyltransferase with HDIG domain
MNPSFRNPAAALRLAPETPAEAGVVESYRRLADVFHDVLSEQSLDALLERIADTVGELIPYDDLHIYEANETARTLKAVFVRGEWAEEVLADRPITFGEGITGWAVEHREPVLANQAHLDPRVRFVANTPIEPESLVSVPLIARGRLKGTLNIYRVGERAAFTDAEFQLAARFGDAAALALDNAHIRASLELQAQTDALTGLFNHRAFHELLRKELLRASAAHATVALVMLDLDDFKRVNDVYGHAIGDTVLAEVAELLRAAVRQGDTICRIGGEEFAIVIPGGDVDVALALARRLAGRLEEKDFEPAGRISVSLGVAIGPLHAANPRELVACAEAAMMTAKARGKHRVVVFDEDATERPEATVARPDDARSIAHLKLLQSASAKLSRLNETGEIGETIADELRRLFDYHNCRVFVREGDELRLVAFRGELMTDDGSGGLERLSTRVGQGITGHVAETGEPLLVGDAARHEFAHQIEGTPNIEESLLAVPLLYGARSVGVVVVSKLGLDQFDADDLRLLEVLAGHAAVALVNARLFEAQRREAEIAKALLEFGRELASAEALAAVFERVAQGSKRLLGADHASVWLQREHHGDLECRAASSSEEADGPKLVGVPLPFDLVRPFTAREEPFVIEPAEYVDIASLMPGQETRSFAVAPFVVDGRWGAIAVAASPQLEFGSRELELLGGVAYQAKLAISTAEGYASLERTFLATVEALANALEAKDEYTSSHTRWITDMALRVARELGVDQATLKRVELGALFHDIGKIGVPAEILAKPGPLTHDERHVIESHPTLGERILAPIEQLEQVRPIVRACHERWDGTGYPDRLAGEEIPLEARIIFACDAFHAMTTDRPYRKALPVEEARRRLAAAAGTQFDPTVVAVCVRVLEAPEASSEA